MITAKEAKKMAIAASRKWEKILLQDVLDSIRQRARSGRYSFSCPLSSYFCSVNEMESLFASLRKLGFNVTVQKTRVSGGAVIPSSVKISWE